MTKMISNDTMMMLTRIYAKSFFDGRIAVSFLLSGQPVRPLKLAKIYD